MDSVLALWRLRAWSNGCANEVAVSRLVGYGVIHTASCLILSMTSLKERRKDNPLGMILQYLLCIV